MSPLEAAHEYLRRGWSIVPLHGWDADTGQCLCSRGRFCPEKNRAKHPSLGNAWQNRALRSGADAQVWFDDHPDDNVGILTGVESGIFVFDVDGSAGIKSVTSLTGEHGALPPTRIVRTGSGGLHYFYRHPTHFTVHNSTSWIAPGIDIRGKGGQVVAPPSVSGRGPYEVIADHPVSEAPAWLLDLLKEHSNHIEHGRSAEAKSAEPVDISLMPDAVRVAASTLIGEDQGRFRQFHHIIAVCKENGYTQGQTVTIVAPWCAAVDKFVGRIEAEVARCWGKLEAETQRTAEWLDDVTPATPNPAPTQPDPTESSAPQSDGTAALAAVPDLDDQSDDPDEVPDPDPTWRPVDLTSILDGTYEPEKPALFPRTDDQNLIYPGRIHSFHGESESGKSLIAQIEVARLVQSGHNCLYIDFESDAGAVVGRMLDLSCSTDQIRSHFTYLRPDNDPRRFAHERTELFAVLQSDPELIIIDGVTDALGIFGAGSTDNDEITSFMRAFPRMLARRTGAAVILIDHVTKDAESRGRYAVGGQAKMNALDGSAFVVEVVEPLGRGLRGVVSMRVAKDRPGGVRPFSGTFRKGDRTQESARVVIDSTTGPIVATVEPPAGHIGDAPRPGGFRPTVVMQKVSEFLEGADEGVSWRGLRDGLGGNQDILRKAIAILDKEGFIGIKKGPNNSRLHSSTNDYRSHADELSDDYTGWISDPVGPWVQVGPWVGPNRTKQVGPGRSPPYGDRTHSWGSKNH